MTSEQVQAFRDSEWVAVAMDCGPDTAGVGIAYAKADILQTGPAIARKAWNNRFRSAAAYYETSKGAAHAWRVMTFAMAALQRAHHKA